MQKHVNLVDLVKSFPTNIYLQNLASIQKRTSPVTFAHLAEKSGKGSISNLSTKVTAQLGPLIDGARTVAEVARRARVELPLAQLAVRNLAFARCVHIYLCSNFKLERILSNF